MTRNRERLWRAVLLDADRHARMFLLYAMSGMECVIVDDITPKRKVA